GEIDRLVNRRAAVLRHDVSQRRRQRRIGIKTGEVDRFEVAPQRTEIAWYDPPGIERGIKLRGLLRTVRQEGQTAIFISDDERRVEVRCENETRSAFGLVQLFEFAFDPAHLARGVNQLFYPLVSFLLDRVAMVRVA